MAYKDNYLTEYRQFFEDFASTVEPNDQLPVKLGSYKFINSEVVGGIVDWCLQYLNKKSCPSTLISPLIKLTIDEIRIACRKHPVACGFNPHENVYEPLKLMQAVMSKMNEICLRFLDNSQLDNLPAPPEITPPQVSVCATRNTRKRMEDRHIVIHDINSMFNIQDSSPASYYAIFDGHAGQDAASYSAAHLHQFLCESDYYSTNPERALREAFLKTDEYFIQKSKIENFRSGTTAVCALLKPKEETLYVAWVGDSQALLVNRGKVLQIVKPHKPSREDEKDRIEANGGCVMFWGMWRVNGQLAVSRAIGDYKLKPYVTAEPDIVAVSLDGNEEFLIMACDGLWDFVSEDNAAIAVYKKIKENPENVDGIAEHLSDIAKQEGSRDNISVIVIFLKDPTNIANKISTDWGWTPKVSVANTAMETSIDIDNTSNTIKNSNIDTKNAVDLFDVLQNPVDFKSVITTDNNPSLYNFDKSLNGKRLTENFNNDDDEDFGPETNVDAIDDVLLSPNSPSSKVLIGCNTIKDIINNPDMMDTEDNDEDLYEHENSDYVPGTQTLLADTALNSSCLTENVVESEDSEDEWNYYRIDPKQKENSALSVKNNDKNICDNEIDIKLDEMSQLNPDAKEFYPVSPTRNSAISPVPNFNRDVVDDTLVARSPRRAVPMDINIPSPVEFYRGARQRPSELFEENSNTTSDSQNDNQLSSQEIMQNLLNGKDPSEIEFHPSNNGPSLEKEGLGIIPKENVPPVDLISEALTEDNTDNSPVITSTECPMSMSIYQEKEEDVKLSPDLDDLNKVQMLPDSIDDIEQSSQESTKPIDMDTPEESEKDIDMCQLSPTIPDTKLSDISPSQELSDQDICNISNDNAVSPVIKDENMENKCDEMSPIQNDILDMSPLPKEPEIPVEFENVENNIDLQENIDMLPVPNEIVEQNKGEEFSCVLNENTDIHFEQDNSKTPIEKDASPFPTDDLETISTHSEVEISKSPLLDIPPPSSDMSCPVEPLSPKSPLPELTGLISPDLTAPINNENVLEEINEITKSPELSQPMNDDNLQSPIPEIENVIEKSSPSPIQQVDNIDLVCSQEMHTEVPITENKNTNNPFCIPDETFNTIEDNKIVESNFNDRICNMKQEALDNNKIVPETIENNILTPNNELEDIIETKEVTNEIKENILEDTNNTINIINDTCQAESPILITNDNESNKVITEEPINEICQQTEQMEQPKTPENMNTSVVESEVAPSEIINSFLDRSVVPEATSPLSPNNDIEKFLQEPPETLKSENPLPTEQDNQIVIKCETIQPEYPVHTIASPCEESMETPAIVSEVVEAKETCPKPNDELEIMEKPIEKEIIYTAANTKPAVKVKSEPGAIKKAPNKLSTTTSPVKSLPPKTTINKKPAASNLLTKTTGTKLTPTKPKTLSSPVSSPKTTTLNKATTKPRTPTTTTTSTLKASSDKKPITNGDVKMPLKQTVLKKTTSTVPSKLGTLKTSPSVTNTTTTRSSLTIKTLTSTTRATTNRPITAGSTTSRTSNLTSKPAPITKTAVSKTTTTGTTRPNATTTTKPKLSTTTTTTTAAPRPRTNLTAAKPLAKTTNEKQIKETVNKQLSASRTSTTKPSNTTTTTVHRITNKKIDTKVPLSNRTSNTLRTTTSVKPSTTSKKPAPITKPKSVALKPNIEQNDIINVTEVTPVNIVNKDEESEPKLIKDNSPVDTASNVDNSQLLLTNIS